MLRCGRANRPKPEPSVGSLGLCTQKALLESSSENDSGKILNGLVAVDSMRPEKLLNPGTWISEPPETTNLLKFGVGLNRVEPPPNHLRYLALLCAELSTSYQPVLNCFHGIPYEQALKCCDTSLGPQGLEDCWDQSFSFEACCSKGFDFELQYCCGAYAAKCAHFSFHCFPETRCEIENAGGSPSTCDNGRLLSPPRYTTIHEMSGDFHRGQKLRLRGTIFLSDEMIRQYQAKFRAIGKESFGSFLEEKNYSPCSGEFELGLNERFGTCLRPDPIRIQRKQQLARPLLDLECETICRMPNCKTYAAVTMLKSQDVEENHLILAVPGACSHGDVAFRLIPLLIRERTAQNIEVKLHQTLPDDECQHDGNPSIWPACAAFAFLFLVPKILEKFVFSSTKLSTLTFSEPSVNAVDVVRAIAIWYSTFASFQSLFPSRLADAVNGPNDLHQLLLSCFQGLYGVVTVYLVLSCDSLPMFCKRLLRKVSRQFLVPLFAGLWMPTLFFTSSPMNCINRSSVTHLKSWPAGRWFLCLLTATAGGQVSEDLWPTYVEAFQDLQEVLLIGSLGILRPHLWSQVLPSATMLYWAYLMALKPDAVSSMQAFWMHRFPSSLIFLNLDTMLRSSGALGLLKRSWLCVF
eukprot:symbB.v1.2.018418.t1/scaffold1470.1/size116919/1